MNKIFAFIVCIISFMPSFAADDINGKAAERPIILSGGHPTPRIYEAADPIAMYNIETQVLTITLDPVYYSDYTITLVSDLIEVDYYPFNSVVTLPTADMGDVVDILIESDDCGTYEGVLDKTMFANPGM